MKDHVPTLETCQKLEEAGFNPFTQFVWRIPADEVRRAIHPGDLMLRTLLEPDSHKWFVVAPAPILTEILEELPSGVKVISTPSSYQVKNSWKTTQRPNPAEAAALLWLELNRRAE